MPLLVVLYCYSTLIRSNAADAHPVLLDSVPLLVNTTQYRTIWFIVRSSLATIFACVWTAVHLNVPDPRGIWYITLRRRLWATMYAFLAPEFVLAWAGRQYLAAGTIAKSNQVFSEMARITFREAEDYFPREILPAEASTATGTSDAHAARDGPEKAMETETETFLLVDLEPSNENQGPFYISFGQAFS